MGLTTTLSFISNSDGHEETLSESAFVPGHHRGGDIRLRQVRDLRSGPVELPREAQVGLFL